jgi:hypothetical protein
MTTALFLIEDICLKSITTFKDYVLLALNEELLERKVAAPV